MLPAGAFRLLLRHPQTVTGLLMAGAVVAILVVGPLIAPFSPTKVGVGNPASAPSATHWLGTHDLGRDVWSRFLTGGVGIVVVPVAAVTLAFLVGGVAGALAAYRGGLFRSHSDRDRRHSSANPFAASGMEAIREDALIQEWPELVRVSGVGEEHPALRRDLYPLACDDHLLRDGSDPAPAGVPTASADGEPVVAQGQFRQARCRHLANQGPFKRPGRPDGGRRRKAVAGLSRPRTGRIRLLAAARVWPSHGRVRCGDGARRGQGLHRTGR